MVQTKLHFLLAANHFKKYICMLDFVQNRQVSILILIAVLKCLKWISLLTLFNRFFWFVPIGALYSKFLTCKMAH